MDTYELSIGVLSRRNGAFGVLTHRYDVSLTLYFGNVQVVEISLQATYPAQTRRATEWASGGAGLSD